MGRAVEYFWRAGEFFALQFLIFCELGLTNGKLSLF